MKVTKAEKTWLILTAIFYTAYNIPGLPAYHQPVPTLVHAALTVIPIWVLAYVFMAKINKIYKIKDEKKEDK